MQANMNCRRVVTIMMFPMVLMATNTHWTTCWNTTVTTKSQKEAPNPKDQLKTTK